MVSALLFEKGFRRFSKPPQLPQSAGFQETYRPDYLLEQRHRPGTHLPAGLNRAQALAPLALAPHRYLDFPRFWRPACFLWRKSAVPEHASETILPLFPPPPFLP